MKHLLLSLIFASGVAMGAMPAARAQTMTGQKVFELLTSEHERIMGMFDEISSKNENSTQTLEQLRQQLTKHMNAEEQYLYPAIEQQGNMQQVIQNSYQEHKEAMDIIEGLSDDMSDSEWLNQVEKAREAIQQHVQQEESKVFAQAEQALDQNKVQQITQQVRQELNQ